MYLWKNSQWSLSQNLQKFTSKSGDIDVAWRRANGAGIADADDGFRSGSLVVR